MIKQMHVPEEEPEDVSISLGQRPTPLGACKHCMKEAEKHACAQDTCVCNHPNEPLNWCIRSKGRHLIHL